MTNPAGEQSFLNRDQVIFDQAESVVYKQIEGATPLDAHVFFPPGFQKTDSRPAMLFFFGSDWAQGRIGQFGPQALHFASRGAVSILMDYRTSSHYQGGPLSAMQDGRSAVRWVRFYAEQLGVNPDQVTTIGATAGANIAAATAMSDSFPDDDTDPPLSCIPDAMVLFSPLLDIINGGYGSAEFDSPTAMKLASLSSYIREEIPPMAILAGTADRLTPFDTLAKFAKRMRKKKNRCDLMPFEGREHSFFNLNVDPVCYEVALNMADDFLTDLGFLTPREPEDGEEETVRFLD